jgi:UDP-N-acetylglucosamine:LPS N-acetylglucosamine transferase
MKTYKVVIFIANIGGGHMAPAKAIAKVLSESKRAKYEVKIIDLLKRSDVAPYNSSDALYQLVTDNWTMQKFNDIAFKSINFGYPLYESFLVSKLLEPAREMIAAEKPDLVIANHPDVSAAVNAVKKTQGGFFYASQITDAKIFLKGAISESAEAILAPTQVVIDKCLRVRIPKEKIIGPGFTTNPDFGQPRDRKEFMKEIGLDPSKPAILLTAGGVGFSSVLNAVKKLASRPEWQVMVMCGRMEELAARLREEYVDSKQMKIFDFTNNMADFYNAADVVVAKPGMSAVIESEIMNKKTIYTKPVAEQERGNVIYALKSPLARFIRRDWNKLNDTVEELLTLEIPKSWKPRHTWDDTHRVVEKLEDKFLSSIYARNRI